MNLYVYQRFIWGEDLVKIKGLKKRGNNRLLYL